MSDEKIQEETVSFEPKITFSGAGVLHIKSSDIVKTENAKKQIEALGKLKEKERMYFFLCNCQI